MLKSWNEIEAELVAFVVHLTVPASAAIVIFALLSSHQAIGSSLVFAAALLHFGTTVVVRFTKSIMIQKASIVFGTWMFAVAGLVQLGPFLGVAFLMTAFVVLSTIFYAIRGGVLSYLVVLTTVGTVGWLGHAGFLTDSQYPWLQIWVATVLALAAVMLLVNRLVSVLQTSIATGQIYYREHVEFDEQRERILKHAMHAERLESLGILAGGVAHDFNNSLVVIRGGIDILTDIVPEEETELLEMMRESADAAAETARSLMTFARQQAPEGESCKPHETLAALSQKVRKLFGKNINIVWHLEETPPVVLGPRYLDDSLLQLLSNARDAMPDGGNITVTCVLVDQNVEVSVTDSGLGISPAALERVFEPFFTTKGEQASGLGLALVWGHMQKCQGDVALKSVLGEGTTVTLILPLAKT